MTPKEFDKKFANKPIIITNSPSATSFGAPNLMLPGDRAYFKNIKDYRETRGKQNVSGAYGGEQTVYLGGGLYCGFPLGSTYDQIALRKELFKNYIAGHKDLEKWNGDVPFIEWLIDNLPIDLSKQMPITSQSQIDRNARK